MIKIGAVRNLPNIYYITRDFTGQRKDVRLMMRFNYTKKLEGDIGRYGTLYREINQMELAFNLTNDMNFDICFGGSKLMLFVPQRRI